MKMMKSIKVSPGLHPDEALTGAEDIRREIKKSPKPDIFPDKVINLGACSFGMAVLQSSWALNEMEPGKILKTISSHI